MYIHIYMHFHDCLLKFLYVRVCLTHRVCVTLRVVCERVFLCHTVSNLCGTVCMYIYVYIYIYTHMLLRVLYVLPVAQPYLQF
jgi:hypothetical protein